MQMNAKRLNKLTNLAVRSAMAVLEAGLPEFKRVPLMDLKDDIEMSLSDLIESHINGLTDEERN